MPLNGTKYALPFPESGFQTRQGHRFAILDDARQCYRRYDTVNRRFSAHRRPVSPKPSLVVSGSPATGQHPLWTQSPAQLPYDVFLATICPLSLLTARQQSGHPIPRCEVLSSPRLPVRTAACVSTMRLQTENEDHCPRAH